MVRVGSPAAHADAHPVVHAAPFNPYPLSHLDGAAYQYQDDYALADLDAFAHRDACAECDVDTDRHVDAGWPDGDTGAERYACSAYSDGLLDLVAPEETGVHTSTLALDVDKQVSAGTAAEIRFFVDYARVVQTTLRIPPFTNVDLEGGTPDVSFDGVQLTAINGAALMPLVDVKLSDAHYDLLEKVEDAVVKPEAGQLIALHTAEGGRGCLRVARWSEDALQVEYFIYG